jgi:ATP-dependent protease ClpP protease subunit
VRSPAYMQEWLEDARSGLVRVDGLIDDELCDLIKLVATGWARRRYPEQITIDIDCAVGGHSCVWSTATTLARLSNGNIETIVHGYAISAGLILSLAGDRRSCYPDSIFQFHGSEYKRGQNPERLADDGHRCRWFAARTGQSEAFWLEKAEDGCPWYFEAEEALAIGVVHQIVGAAGEDELKRSNAR